MQTRALAAAILAAAVFGAVPGSALAGARPAGVPTTTTPSSAPSTVKPAKTPTKAPAVAGTASLHFQGTFDVKRDNVTVPGRDVHVSGDITPWRAGQRVTVEAIQGGRVVGRKTKILIASPAKVYGTFATTFKFSRAGKVEIKVVHRRSSKLYSFSAAKAFTVLSTDVSPGATGRFVQLIQSRLQALHVYDPQTGVYDQFMELALDTYHRVLGWGEGDTALDARTINDLLNGAGTFHIRYPSQGGTTEMHAEGDLSIQVLAYIKDDQVVYLLPISSGKPSTPTVLGEYQVYRKQPEYTSDGMYFSNFFTGGYAIHGYDPAPDYPASHGCMRIPIVDAIFAYNLLNIGDWVDTYYT